MAITSSNQKIRLNCNWTKSATPADANGMETSERAQAAPSCPRPGHLQVGGEEGHRQAPPGDADERSEPVVERQQPVLDREKRRIMRKQARLESLARDRHAEPPTLSITRKQNASAPVVSKMQRVVEFMPNPPGALGLIDAYGGFVQCRAGVAAARSGAGGTMRARRACDIMRRVRLREVNVGCFGGGTGLPSLLGGLKQNPWLRVNAVVTMFDSGGSSGQLRDELGVLPPGDVLKCALALARNESEARVSCFRAFPHWRTDGSGDTPAATCSCR